MLFFDGMNKFGLEINEENSKYYLTYDMGDLTNRLDTLEISQEDAQLLKNVCEVANSPEERRQASQTSTQIILKYQNLKFGLT